MKPFKIGNVIMCEYIVEGVNNKHTLINTYAGDILVNEIPAQIPIAFYMEFIPTVSRTEHLKMRILVGGTEAVGGIAQVEFEAGRPAILVISMGLLRVEKPTSLRVFIQSGEERPIKVLERKISANASVNP